MANNLSSSERSVSGMEERETDALSEKALSIKEYSIRLPLAGDFPKTLLNELAIDVDRIVCGFLLMATYLFIAIEEADYQVLSASTKEMGTGEMPQNNHWSLNNLSAVVITRAKKMIGK